jgi:cell shape-determining protein MreC
VTSGIEGSSYPPDLVVGVISEVEFDTRLLEQEISVRLIADLDDLRFVTIILWTVDGDSTS